MALLILMTFLAPRKIKVFCDFFRVVLQHTSATMAIFSMDCRIVFLILCFSSYDLFLLILAQALGFISVVRNVKWLERARMNLD